MHGQQLWHGYGLVWTAVGTSMGLRIWGRNLVTKAKPETQICSGTPFPVISCSCCALNTGPPPLKMLVLVSISIFNNFLHGNPHFVEAWVEGLPGAPESDSLKWIMISYLISCCLDQIRKRDEANTVYSLRKLGVMEVWGIGGMERI